MKPRKRSRGHARLRHLPRRAFLRALRRQSPPGQRKRNWLRARKPSANSMPVLTTCNRKSASCSNRLKAKTNNSQE
ncbi:MAG: DUF2934 domain-containing protein [Zoogloeaceae bacterium]|nr:DUF2934 domain-containing protein [Zoogloeaceae bacterium]